MSTIQNMDNINVIQDEYFNKHNNLNHKYINQRVLNYTRDTFKGVNFKWSYEVTKKGYKIVNIKALCSLCSSEMENEHLIDEEVVTSTCYNCFYDTYKYGDNICNNKAQLIYNQDQYNNLINLVRNEIKYNILVLKSEVS